ncbi:hypothetical protein [Geodermatophilus sp. SYSU D00684]
MGSRGENGRGLRGAPEGPQDAAPPAVSSFTEAIDRRTGRIRASGRLDTRAADMLRGTVDALRREGCTWVVVDLDGVQADDAGADAVRSLERGVVADGGHMTLVNWQDRGPGRLDGHTGDPGRTG